MATSNSNIPDVTQSMLDGSDSGPSADHIRSVFVRYGELLTAGDTNGVVALFAEDAVIRDPVTSPEHRGLDELRAFYQSGFEAMNGGIEMKLDGAVRIVGPYGAAAYIARTVNFDPVYKTETLDVMTFDDEGKITSMMAYWGPANFMYDGGMDE